VTAELRRGATTLRSPVRLKTSPPTVHRLLAACLLVAVACTPESGREGSGDGRPAFTTGSSSPGVSSGGDQNNSADGLIFWIDHREFSPLSDAELRQWKDRGVDGFVSVVQWLKGLGGAQDYTGDPNASLAGDAYAYQRQLRDSRVVERANQLGMKNYMGFYFANQTGGTTPLRDWFDDGGWSGTVLPRIRDLAAAAKQLGFAGLAFDQELYPQADNAQKASWSVGYIGNSRPESEVRNKIKQRGREIMTTILEVFPDVEIVSYAAQFPESWEELVQEQANKIPNAMASNGLIDLWNGLTSVPGYKAIRFVDAIFYKSTQVRSASWDNALQYNANRTYSLLSRRWENWAYASSRVHVGPFSWIDEGTTRFEAARSPDDVEDQLQAFRKWGTGREFANFAYTFKTFDYTPYTKAMQAASAPGVVDTKAPELKVESQRATDGKLSISGTTTDNLAIRAVRWQVVDGPSGAARMTWKVKGGSYTTGYDWEMTWTAEGIPLQRGRNEVLVTSEDIKGLATTTTLSVPV
jgi:hypothetical protein